MNRLARALLRQRWPYRLAGLYLATRRGYACRALRTMALAGLDQARAWYRRERPVVWTTAFVPTEILYALDLNPFAVEVATALAGSLGLAPRLLAAAEQAWYSADLCAFHRCALGGALLDYWPRPDALVASSHLCDGAPRLFHNLAQWYGVPLWIIDVPTTRSAGAAAYLAEQLAELAGGLARLTGRRLTGEGLARAFRHSNEARSWLLAANRWRRADPAVFAGQRALDFLWVGFMGQGSPAAVRVYREYATELARRVARGQGVVPQAKYRLLWLHLKPYYPVEFWRFLSEAGAVVAFEEFSEVYWPELVAEKPWASLAQKMQSHFALGSWERRLNTIKRLVRVYRCDGVIHFAHWGCRQSNGPVRLIKEELQAAGIPLLILPGDCLDRRHYAVGQNLTRLAAFLELLEERRRGAAARDNPEQRPGASG